MRIRGWWTNRGNPSAGNDRDCDGCGTTQILAPDGQSLHAFYSLGLILHLWGRLVHERGRLAAVVRQIRCEDCVRAATSGIVHLFSSRNQGSDWTQVEFEGW